MSSLLNSEEYGLVMTGCASELGNLTEEEDIWMIQCPVSVSMCLCMYCILVYANLNRIDVTTVLIQINYYRYVHF
jgi:hypothetical protein